MTSECDPRPAPPWRDDLDLRTFATVEYPREMFIGEGFSDLSAEAFRAVVRLIDFAWHQVPAGSLPEDPAMLCDKAGFGRDLRSWQALEAEVLGVWTHCSDNRFYLVRWKEVLETAFDRKRTRSKGNIVSALRATFRKDLEKIGVPNVKSIPPRVLDEAREAAIERGLKELRGPGRADLLSMIASDFGLLPKEMGDDIRLSAKFGAGRGRGLTKISEVKRGGR